MASIPLLTLDTAALRLLSERVDQYIKANEINLARGNAVVNGDANATAMNYCRTVGYIHALNDVLALCEEVEEKLRKG